MIADIFVDVEFGFATVVAHISYFTEDRAFAPCAVVYAADAPSDARVSVRVAPVKLVFVVEVDGGAHGFFRGRGPFEDFFAPVHAHESVHLALGGHLPLGGVP